MYPKIVIGTDNVYEVFIDENVEIKFEKAEDVEEFFKTKSFTVEGLETHDRKQDGKNMLISDIRDLII